MFLSKIDGDRGSSPVTALGIEKSHVPLPLGAHQVLSLHDVADVRQLFRDLRIAVADAERFVGEVREVGELSGGNHVS